MEKRKFKHPVNQKTMFGEQSFFIYDTFIINILQAHVKQDSLNILYFFPEEEIEMQATGESLFVLSRSVMSDSLRPHGPQSARLLCPQDSPGKNTGVGCHALLQGIFQTQVWSPGLLHCRQILYHLSRHLFRY